MEPGTAAVSIAVRVPRFAARGSFARKLARPPGRTRREAGRYPAAGTVAAAQLPEVRARRGERHRFDMGLAGTRAAPRTADAAARLDLFTAGGAALRHRQPG